MSNEISAKWKKNSMLKPSIAKVTVNMSVGQSGEKVQKAAKVLEALTGQKPVMLQAKNTIRDWGIHKKETIACKVTLRGKRAEDFLKKSLDVVDLRIPEKSVDQFGNFAFGFGEHIELDLKGAKYDPNLGIFGMDVAVTLERPGFRTIRRRVRRQPIPRRQRVTRDETIHILQKEYKVNVYRPEEEEE
ncbi:MAG: 50S ribosomal protein L5 [Candidatus Ranarchaeia archaeon]|jgi:large subunit ribosomal protein L5